MRYSKSFILCPLSFVLSSLLFAQNVWVETPGGPDLYPWIVKDSKGNLYVVSENEIVKGDYDAHIVKSTNEGKRWFSATGSGWSLSYPFVNNRRPGVIIGKRDSILIFCEGPYQKDTIVDNNFFWIVSTSGGSGWSPPTYIRDTQWYEDCSHPIGADNPPSERLMVFQCDTNPKNPDILGFYFTGTNIYIKDIAHSSKPEKYPCIAVTPDGFIVAYEYYDKGWDIRAVKVVGGEPSPPMVIATDPDVDERQPYLVSSGNYVYCAYSRGNDVYIAYSTDGGNDFECVPVATSSKVEHWPAVACKGKIVDVAYYHGSGNIYHQRSTDNGETWTEPDIVTTEPTAVDTPRVSILYDDTCHIVWIDKRKGELDIYYGKPTIAGIEEVVFNEGARFIEVSPNPAKAVVSVKCQVPSEGPISLQIYDASGRLVRTLTKAQSLKPKVYAVEWDGRDSKGVRVPSGVYFICLKRDKGIHTKRVVLIR